MLFELLTLSGTKYSGQAASVQLTTVDGDIGIQPHHEHLVAKVIGGPVIVQPVDGKQQVFATYGGLLDVGPDRVRLLADEAEHADDLIATEVEEALARAHELRAAAKDKHELARAQEMVDREGVRLGVAKMRRTHRHERPEGADKS